MMQPSDEGFKLDKEEVAEFKSFGRYTIAVFLFIVVGFLALSYVIEHKFLNMSFAEEVRWGQRMLSSRIKDSKKLEDEPRLITVHKLTFDMLPNDEVMDAAQVYLYPKKYSNAFIGPGAQIFVTEGLLSSLESENELAFVLGHEVGHYVLNHVIKGAAQNRSRLAMNFVAFFLPDPIGSWVGNSVDLLSFKFSRDQESAADRFALEQMMKQYGHINHATRFFEKSTQSRGFLREYKSTHPNSEKRIKQIKKWSQDKDWPLDGDLTPLPKAFSI